MPATKTALKPATPAFPTHIDLPEEDRQPVIELLNGRLADTADLYSQIKQAHWNVKGPNFFSFMGCSTSWRQRYSRWLTLSPRGLPLWAARLWELREWRLRIQRCLNIRWKRRKGKPI